MRFSLWTSLGNPWSDVLDGIRHAEATGWDGVYVADHFMPDAAVGGPTDAPMLEATGVLAATAAVTTRVRLAPLVLGITYRHPAVLANWAATVDHISGGRLLLGVGAGWQVNEHEQYGIRLGPPGERIERFEEALRILRGLLEEPSTTVEGRHYEVRDAIAEPKPVQRPLPILVGGKGDRMLGVVARHADEWNMWSTPELLAERRAVLDRRCEAIGRDPTSIATSTQALFFVLDHDDPERIAALRASIGARPVAAGTPAGIAETVEAWRLAGADEIIVPDFTLGTGARRADALDALAAELFPRFRDTARTSAG